MTAVACVIVVSVLATVNVCIVQSLQVIPERATVVYVNDKYANGIKLYVKRFSRRSNYYMNLDGTVKHTWANNVSMHFVFYEFLHNEYKRSFVELNFKICDLINNGVYIGLALRNAGVVCPIQKGFLRINNLTIPVHNFPNVWPFEKCKVDIKIKLISPEELIFNGEMYITMKQNVGK